LPIGTRVILNPAVTCGRCEYCATGNHGTCRERRAIGRKRDGGYGEYVLIPRENVLELADSVSFERATTIPSTHFTSWQMLYMRAGESYGTRSAVEENAPIGARAYERRGSRRFSSPEFGLPQASSNSPIILNPAGPGTYSDASGDSYTQAGPHGVINNRTGEFSPTN
jgi:hypothetical protein